ncbi:hypothetical protein NB2BOR_A31370 [Bordetella parapertussis]|nr:hypothetical protein NB2BOR_A31370 [Bordetella parapertussis]
MPTESEYFCPTRFCTGWASQSGPLGVVADPGAALEEVWLEAGGLESVRVPEAQAVRSASSAMGINFQIMGNSLKLGTDGMSMIVEAGHGWGARRARAPGRLDGAAPTRDDARFGAQPEKAQWTNSRR